jgi:hypothetical protein
MMVIVCVCSYQYTHTVIFMAECAVTLPLNTVRNDDVALKSTGVFILEKGKALNDGNH